ncbi:MAG TPA: nucleotidyltransferase domain-containing protein, partial [Thermoanaerobaculia bacterium]|nr:nucleotidyltransferase domain-containing protein [Thermoanaerobaculia bacterium]
PNSDLDVAVLPETQEPRARWRLQTGVAAALADLAPEGRVDVVFLDEAPVTLRQSVMEHGRVLINRDPEAWKELRIRTMREYGDSEWARELYRKAQKRRLERREPSGRSPKALESLRRSGRLSP